MDPFFLSRLQQLHYQFLSLDQSCYQLLGLMVAKDFFTNAFNDGRTEPMVCDASFQHLFVK
jgi:hypothetical protein